MRLSGEQSQHAGCVGCVPRLAEHFVIDQDDGVRAEDYGVRCDRVSGEDSFGLLAREPGDEADWIFTGIADFRYVRADDIEGETGLREELAAAWRCRG
jgi:hypothetical protein